MRPRGESISCPQRTYVGHAGRQKPQWTHLSMMAGAGGWCESKAERSGLEGVVIREKSATDSLPSRAAHREKNIEGEPYFDLAPENADANPSAINPPPETLRWKRRSRKLPR